MISAENEKVALAEDVSTDKDVEGWLNDFESAMRKTIKKILQRALAAYAKMPREQCIIKEKKKEKRGGGNERKRT
jgi:hypothetical protein